MTPLDTLRQYCQALRLPTAAAVLEESLALAQREAGPPKPSSCTSWNKN